MKKNIYFIEEITEFKNLKREIKNVKEKVNFNISLIDSIKIFIIEYFKALKFNIGNIFNKNNNNLYLIVTLFALSLSVLFALCLSFKMAEYYISNWKYIIWTSFNYNFEILFIFYFTIVLYSIVVTWIFRKFFLAFFDIEKNNIIKENYWLWKDRQLSVIKINQYKFIFPKKIDFEKISQQLDFIIELLININKIEWTLDTQNKNKLKKIISNILEYKDYIKYINLFDIDTISKDKLYKYYMDILWFIDKIDENIIEIKDSKLYKFNFWPESKILKKKLEKRYNYINKQITKIKSSLEEVEENQIKTELTSILKILEKEEKELNIIRKWYTNVTILEKKLDIINKLNKEFNYINKENNSIKELEKENDINDLLKTILQ